MLEHLAPVIREILGDIGSGVVVYASRDAIIKIGKRTFEEVNAIIEDKIQKNRNIKYKVKKSHNFPRDYTGPVLVQIKNLEEKSEALIWWGKWIKQDILSPKKEQYIFFRKRNKDGWPITVFLEKEASIEFIHHVVDNVHWSDI